MPRRKLNNTFNKKDSDFEREEENLFLIQLNRRISRKKKFQLGLERLGHFYLNDIVPIKLRIKKDIYIFPFAFMRLYDSHFSADSERYIELWVELVKEFNIKR